MGVEQHMVVIVSSWDRQQLSGTDGTSLQVGV